MNDVTDVMEPVAPLLVTRSLADSQTRTHMVAQDALQLPAKSKDEFNRRSQLLLRIGRHVNTELAKRASGAHDEGGRDARWWYDALWSYVGAHMPSSEVFTPQKVEGWYQSREDKIQAKNRLPARQVAGSDDLTYTDCCDCRTGDL